MSPKAKAVAAKTKTSAATKATPNETLVLDAAGVRSAIASIAKSIEADEKNAAVAIVGIQSRGVPLAARIADALHKSRGKRVDVGSLDITLYRDDLSTVGTRPILKATNIPFSIDGRPVVLVDDVLYTGRTIRAALDELVDFGRPSRITLAVLIDRGHRELPIQADYVGKTIKTTRSEQIDVRLVEIDGRDEVAKRA
jgi:pyrimidine operon attenuation protein/uracil phosphoribosyltransferase